MQRLLTFILWKNWMSSLGITDGARFRGWVELVGTPSLSFFSTNVEQRRRNMNTWQTWMLISNLWSKSEWKGLHDVAFWSFLLNWAITSKYSMTVIDTPPPLLGCLHLRNSHLHVFIISLLKNAHTFSCTISKYLFCTSMLATRTIIWKILNHNNVNINTTMWRC